MLKGIKNIVNDKISSKLAIQLIMSFLGMFFLIIAVSSAFVYIGIVSILKNNSEINSIRQFEQYEYNINTFRNEVDLISRQLIINADLQGIIDYSRMSESDRTILVSAAFRNFTKMLSNFQYIDSIIYYGADGLILRATANQTVTVFDEAGKKDRFYNSEFFHTAKEHKMKSVWFGGFTDNDFNINVDPDNSEISNSNYYMSTARTIFSGSQNGTLIINININYFTSIYNHENGSNIDEMYIIDQSGKIISHSDISKIGNQSITYRKMDANRKVENFIITDQHRQKQVINYQLGTTGWILVNEVPMKVIMKDTLKLRNIVFLTFLASLILAAGMSRYWIFRIIKPLNKLTAVMRKVEGGNLGLTLDVSSKTEVGLLINQFNSMSTGIKELIGQNEVIQEDKRKMEMEALRAQINPHFIYNTLNTIKWMAVIKKADNIVESLSTLSDFLQPIFKNHNTMCTIAEEIDYIKNYIKIMNYRFAGGFTTRINIPDVLLSCWIIRFLLQPVVENALVHGLMSQNGGEVCITVWEQDQDILVKVADNGGGVTEARLREINDALAAGTDLCRNGETGIGLVNVNKRTKLHFGEAYGLEMKSQMGWGTEVILRMPLVRKS